MALKGKLRYNISDWRQLSQCMSNISTEYHIRVRMSNYDKLVGTVIEVYHDRLGALFTYLTEAHGDLIDARETGAPDMSVDEILDELSRFGFIVTFQRRAYLSVDQVEYLKSIRGLNFDKLRVLYVYQYTVTGAKHKVPHVVAFNVEKNVQWLDTSYVASLTEFTNSLDNGSAINLDDISKKSNFKWNWLDYVANIDDVLADNARPGDSPDTSSYTKSEIDKKLDVINSMVYAIGYKTDDVVKRADAGEFDGDDGFSPIVDITDIEHGHNVSITDVEGVKSMDVMDGEKGDKGDDYVLTDQDKEEIVSEVEDRTAVYIEEV